jgi:hypothetical protein
MLKEASWFAGGLLFFRWMGALLVLLISNVFMAIVVMIAAIYFVFGK